MRLKRLKTQLEIAPSEVKVRRKVLVLFYMTLVDVKLRFTKFLIFKPNLSKRIKKLVWFMLEILILWQKVKHNIVILQLGPLYNISCFHLNHILKLLPILNMSNKIIIANMIIYNYHCHFYLVR